MISIVAMNQSIYSPLYLQIYQREGTRWYLLPGKVFYNPKNIEIDFDSTLQRNGLTKTEIQIELFRINGGKQGYYLADLKMKKYYYCGTVFDDVKLKLRELGIGRVDPVG
jgi:hypothetical protein